jgi:hypothetical protein
MELQTSLLNACFFFNMGAIHDTAEVPLSFCLNYALNLIKFRGVEERWMVY